MAKAGRKRRAGAAMEIVRAHNGLRSLAIITRMGPASIVPNGGCLVTVQLYITEEDIDHQLGE